MSHLARAVQMCTFLSVVTMLLSIAVSECFLALAFLLWLPIGVEETHQWGRLAIIWPPFFGAVQLYTAATILSVLFSIDPSLCLPVLRKFVLFFLCFLVVRFFDLRWAKRTFFTLFGVASVAGLYSGIQFIEKWWRFQRTHSPLDDPTLIFRVTGFMGHWMTFSGEQGLVLAALLACLVTLPLKRLWLWGAAAVLISASVVLSFTRSIWLASLVVFVLVMVQFRRKILWVIPGVLVILVVVFPRPLHERLNSFLDAGFSSNLGRIEMAKAGWEMFRAHPWLGVGPERVKPEFEAILRSWGESHPPFFTGHLHNNLIQLAAERGILALIAFIWLGLDLLIRFWRGAKQTVFSRERRTLYLAGLLSTVTLMVAGMFEFNFGKSEVLFLFLFFITVPFVKETVESSAEDSSILNPAR